MWEIISDYIIRDREIDRTNEKKYWVRVIIKKIDQYMIRLQTTTQTFCINNFIRERGISSATKSWASKLSILNWLTMI